MQAAWEQIESNPYIDGQHIKAVSDHLQACYEDKIVDLIINVPPGCSKSLVACVFFPAWVWTKSPEKRFFFSSYDAQLSSRDSAKCRVLLETEWYQTMFPGMVKFSKDQNQKTFYQNTAGGWRMASSVCGHGTGVHPHFVLTDDPNNAKQAESPVERQSVADWWKLTMSSRGVTLGVKKIVIQQRLHQEDLTGVCLEMGGYEHLCLPMRYEGARPPTSIGFVDWRTQEGELLAPNQFNEETVRKLEANLGEYGAAGQLQQRPVPRQGGMFHVDKIETVDAAPALMKECRYWDTASSAGKGDYTAGVRMGKDIKTGIYYIMDVVRDQWSSDVRKRTQRQIADLDYAYPICIAVPQIQSEDPGSAGKDQSADFIRLMSGYTAECIRETGAKETRADPFSSQVNAGNVKMVRAAWNKVYLDELRLFPFGKNDDMVDASSGAFSWLENKSRAQFIPDGWSFGASI